MTTGDAGMVGPDVLLRHFNPSRERLWAKIAGLHQTLRTLATPPSPLVGLCGDNLERAKACIQRRWGHAHLAWRFLHRVDEDLLLLLPDDQIQGRAVDVKAAFDLNIAEPAMRAHWLGTATDPGPLATAVEQLQRTSGGGVSNLPQRHILREVLGIVDNHVDKGFWVLSMNVFTTLWSAILLGGLMLLFGVLAQRGTIPALASLGTAPGASLLPIVLLGAAGAYLSNLLTKKDFVFVEGGPFTRFLLHPLLVKPVISAFAAVFVYLLAQSRILFAIVSQAANGGASAPESSATGGLILTAPAEALGYLYAIVAIVSGFAADKLLGDMIGSVIRRLEQTAEKTKSGAEPASGAAGAQGSVTT
ncbi:MAG TPA: hypothetical protein VFL36_00125 [Myxococcales bacterium]|nr:hypothetical protein [Myxococcales bacterium]